MDNQTNTMACGFAHCCAIGGQEANGKGGKLYVWGDNSDQQLMEHPKSGPKQTYLKEPTLIRLKYETDQQGKGNND